MTNTSIPPRTADDVFALPLSERITVSELVRLAGIAELAPSEMLRRLEAEETPR